MSASPMSTPPLAAPEVSIAIRRLGRTPYEATWRAMQNYTLARPPDSADEIWLTEHPPVYTLGLAGRSEHILRSNGIPVVHSDRGGQVTYHGPGQLVAYLMLDLRRRRLGVRDLVRRIEGAVITWLSGLGVDAWGKVSAPGIYVRREGFEAKIASLGLRIRNGCSYHGVAVNVDMDLAPFSDIDPCGYPGLRVTQLAAFGVVRSVAAAGDELAPILARAMDDPATVTTTR